MARGIRFERPHGAPSKLGFGVSIGGKLYQTSREEREAARLAYEAQRKKPKRARKVKP